MPLAAHLGELRTHFTDRARDRDQGAPRVTVAAPSRRRWRQMTALGLWRCPDCRSLTASGRNAARDLRAHDDWHDQLDALLSHILGRLDAIEGAPGAASEHHDGYQIAPGMIPATATEWPREVSHADSD